jgi:aspartyl-tRNA(Asn)/glutamyl-tRNA(Gln) amidotransferase subunit C
MKLNNDTITKIAHLSRLEVQESERETLLKDMNNILSFMEKLNELDTEGVEPLIYLTDEVNVLREDEIKQDITVQEALKNAPKQDGKYFQVARMMQKS